MIQTEECGLQIQAYDSSMMKEDRSHSTDGQRKDGITGTTQAMVEQAMEMGGGGWEMEIGTLGMFMSGSS